MLRQFIGYEYLGYKYLGYEYKVWFETGGGDYII